MEIWKHLSGYSEARSKVLQQDLEADLKLLDDLFGREKLSYGATPDEVKQEALRQLEIEWRDVRDDLAEFHVNAARALCRSGYGKTKRGY